MILVCARCMTSNRVPDERVADDPKCGRCGAPILDGRPVILGESNFDAFTGRAGLPVLVDFWADWCAPCKAMAPAFEQAAAELKWQVRFAKLNTEVAQRIAARFAIRSIPTLVLLKDAKEAARISGALDARSIKAWVARQLA